MSKKVFLVGLALGLISCAGHYVLDPRRWTWPRTAPSG